MYFALAGRPLGGAGVGTATHAAPPYGWHPALLADADERLKRIIQFLEQGEYHRRKVLYFTGTTASP